MALTGALYSGASGIDTYGKALNIVGDNIANVNTVGFKATQPVFFDMLSTEIGGVKVGAGSRLAAADRLFVQGGMATTNNSTDMAIEGQGFFVIKDNQGENFYSRAGQFSLDQDGKLVNAAGLRVQGVQLDASGNPVSGLTDIVMNHQLMFPPQETGSIQLAANLDAGSSQPAVALPADAAGTEDTPSAWYSAGNFTSVMTIYDSLGQAHDLTFVFRQSGAADQWDYRVVANAGEVGGGTAGDLIQVNGAGGKLTFNPDGTLNVGGGTNITAIGPIAWTDGANSQSLAAANLDLKGMTQFAAPSQVTAQSQDGAPTGSLTSFQIGKDGVITGVFSSNRTQALYRVALAGFASPEGLTHVGNSLFAASAASGQPEFGSPNAGPFGSLLSGSLELSTVDLATEFVKMVTTQRAFQANARTITVTDTLLEEVANLKR